MPTKHDGTLPPLRGDTGTLPPLAWFATATREEVAEASKRYAEDN